jgi:hypothetical protein
MTLQVGSLVYIRAGARIWSGSPMDDLSIALERCWGGDTYGIIIHKDTTKINPKGMIYLMARGVFGFVETVDVWLAFP